MGNRAMKHHQQSPHFRSIPIFLQISNISITYDPFCDGSNKSELFLKYCWRLQLLPRSPEITPSWNWSISMQNIHLIRFHIFPHALLATAFSHWFNYKRPYNSLKLTKTDLIVPLHQNVEHSKQLHLSFLDKIAHFFATAKSVKRKFSTPSKLESYIFGS